MNYDIVLFLAQNKTCESRIQRSSGWITPPDMDSDSMYDLNLHCRWTVIVDNSSIIRFQVLFVDIQWSAGCQIADFLQVHVHVSYEPHHEKNPAIYICKNNGADQLHGIRQLISAFVFATVIYC